MTYKITHKNSTAASTPPASGDIDVGEIAINAADAELYVKDTNGNIRKFQNTTTGTAAGVRFTQTGTGAVQRTVESKLQDVVSVKDFGAVGDGVADDTAAIQAFFTHLAGSGGSGYINPGNYKITNDIQLISPAKGFHVFGAGDESCIQLRSASNTNILNVRNGTGITIENVLFDCGYSVTGFAEHGYSFRDANNVIMRAVNVIDHRGAAGLFFLDTTTATATSGNLNGDYRNCYIIDSYSYSNANGQNGFLLETMYASAIVNCHVAALDLTGSPSLGLQLKNKCRYSSIIGGSAEGCLVGVALGGDGAGVGEAGYYCTVSGVIIKNCQSGVALSKTVDCKVDVAVDMINSASNNYGIEVAGNNTGACITAVVSNLPASKYAVRIGSDRTTVNLSINTDIGSGLVAVFDANVDHSSLSLDYNATLGQSGNSLLPSLVTDNSGSTTNSVRYLPAAGGNGLINAATYQFNTISGGQSYIAYNGATPQINVRMNGVDRFNLHPSWLSPVDDNVKTLGRATSRWSVVYAGTGTINTSDEREKQDIEDLSDAELSVATALKSLIKKFRFADAVHQKGTNARIHIGVIAQDVIAAFQAEGLDPMQYGIVCYDQWDAECDKDGNEVSPAGDRYGIRYEELLAFIISTL